MILFILLCFLTGFLLINLINKEEKLLNILISSLPLGIVFHTIIFILLSFINIYYNKYLFIATTLVLLLSLFKRRIKIINNLRDVPIYYVIIAGYIIVRLMIMANTGFFEFYNYDEFTAYQTGSTITYLSHNFTEVYQTYAPVNYFTGTMSLEFSGLSITATRLISVLFFGLTSLFILKALRDNKVNKHISALLAILFLISSSELLQLSKGFYTNIFFMTYFVISIYGITKHYAIDKKKGIPILYFLMIIGLLLTRREAIYLVIIIILLITVYGLIKKLINKKDAIIMNSLIVFPIILHIVEKQYSYKFISNPENTDSIINRIINRLSGSNLEQFLNNAYTQTFKADYYYFNTLLFIIFLITIVAIIVMLIRKKWKNNYLRFSVFVFATEIIYIGIVLATQVLIFTILEYTLAASLSRYIIPVLSINFIVLGCLLFNNTDGIHEIKINDRVKKTNKIIDPKIILIIPAYNEEKSILKTVEGIVKFNKKSKLKYNYIVINDGSKDNTEYILDNNKINHIDLVHNLGIGGAVQTGYKYAYENNYDIAIQFDGDGQHNIDYVSKIIQPIIDGKSELVIGSRFIDKKSDTFKSSFLRRIGIKVISQTMKIMTKEKIYDTTSGFRACNRSIIQKFSKNYPVEYPEPISTVSTINEGHIVSEVQVEMNERTEGKSSISSWKSIYYMINVFLSIIVVGIRRGK